MDSNDDHVSNCSDDSQRNVSRRSTGSQNQPYKGLRYVIEPITFLLFFALNLSGTVFQNQVLYQVCTTVFGYNTSECSNLGTNETKEIETEVQPYAANIFMIRGIFEGVIPSFGSLLVGAWSDKYGRKPVLLGCYLSVLGMYVVLCMIMYLSLEFAINPYYYVLAILPVILTGSTCSIVTCLFCYLADITTERNRAFRMAVNEGVVFLGLMLGSLASTYLYLATDALTVHAVAGAIVGIAVIYIIFILDESLRDCQEVEESRITSLFNWALLKDVFRTCFEKRPKYDRAVIWLIISSLTASIFAMYGASNVFYLFVREKFSWTIKDYNFYDAGQIVVQIFGNIIGMIILQKLFKFSTISVAIVAFVSCTVDAVIKAVATQPWYLYMAVGVSALRGVTSPMCRTLLAQIVPVSDIGKVYSLTTSLETISPLMSSPLYTLVYNKTLTFYPGAFNIISAGVYGICVMFLIFVYILERRFPRNTYAPVST